VEFWLALASAVIVRSRLVRHAWTTIAGITAHAMAHGRLLAQAQAIIEDLTSRHWHRIFASIVGKMIS